MSKFKVNSASDNRRFVRTAAYRRLSKKFWSLKKEKGKIVHVLGAPGTGKSANIYRAIEELDLNVLDVKLELSDDSLSSKEVFHEFSGMLMEQMGTTSKEESYRHFLEFDVVLFADKFHDTHKYSDKAGFSAWTRRVGWRSVGFYILCIQDYLRYYRKFSKTNIVFQTAWRIGFRGREYDIFTDLGVLSWIMVNLLKIFFEVVEISYSEEETIKIVKKHVDASEREIKRLIKKYGSRPRFICMELEGQ